jgi:hypothetical protein
MAGMTNPELPCGNSAFSNGGGTGRVFAYCINA